MNKSVIVIGFVLLIAVGGTAFIAFHSLNQASNTDTSEQDKQTEEPTADSVTSATDESKESDDKGEESTDTSIVTTHSSSSSTANGSNSESDDEETEEEVPESTRERRDGQPLEEFPFPIMVDPPHIQHDPVTDFASVINNNGNYTFILPEVTGDLGLYGRFWLSPEPPTSNAKLAGVRFVGAGWDGTQTNTISVFSLLDRNTEDNALGTVTGAIQGLEDELASVLITEQYSAAIELRLYEPVANSTERFVAVVDAENLPTDDGPWVFPDQITVSRIEWLWTE